jgi:hypothetical protein
MTDVSILEVVEVSGVGWMVADTFNGVRLNHFSFHRTREAAIRHAEMIHSLGADLIEHDLDCRCELKLAEVPNNGTA